MLNHHRAATMHMSSSSLGIFIFFTLLFVVTSTDEGRNLNSDLARRASADPDAYYGQLTGALNRAFEEKSRTTLKQWKKVKRGLNISPKCASVIQYMIEKPIEDEWSARILDSMSTFPAGVLSSTTTELGDFDSCLSVDGAFQGQALVGKYCLATVHLPKRQLYTPFAVNQSALKPAWIGRILEQWHNNDNYYGLATAVCFPSLCHQEEIQSILRAYYPIVNSLEFNVTFCQSREEPPQYHRGIWIALTILALPLIPLLLGTLLECFIDPNSVKSFAGKYLLAHSIIGNTRILFRITDHSHQEAQPDSSEGAGGGGQFAYIHGIRALSSFFVIICHAFGLMIVPLNMLISPYARYPNDIQVTNKMLATQPIFNGFLIVQTFFTMSGMLLTYNALSPKLKITFLPYVLLRWLRYTPPLIGTICLTMALQLLGNGPLFHPDLIWPTVRRCYDSWWRNLLYINNYSDFDQQCSVQTWYLSAEMQLHIIGYLLLLAYLKSPRVAYLTSGCLILLGVGIIFTIVASGLTNLSMFQIFTYTQYPIQNTAAKLVYFAPYMQFISYFLGAIVGQALLEKRRLRLPAWLSSLLWALCAGILVSFMFLTYVLIQEDKVLYTETNVATALPYVGYILLWGLANAWFFYACSANGKNPLARFLSAPIFQPFSRLSFSLYLVHLMTIWYNTHQTRKAISFANLNELNKLICLTIVQSLVLAYALYLTFEAPSVNLMKLLLKPKEKPGEKTSGKTKEQ